MQRGEGKHERCGVSVAAMATLLRCIARRIDRCTPQPVVRELIYGDNLAKLIG
jgi:hypothetical protein